MISEKETTRISKFLSLVLRHQPETIGIRLDENGWTNTQILLEKLNQNRCPIDFETLKYVVDTNVKQRFAFNATFDQIRANQGHSVEVDLGYEEQTPPPILYHGTAEKFVDSIWEQGLKKQKRHHVHLSPDLQTALKVGQRHGKPFVFEVLAGKMHENGFVFYRSENGVWLTDHVPPSYLQTYKKG